MGMGVTEIGIIRDAVRSYIESRISADDDLKARFETEREKIRTARQQPIRLIKGENGG
jgi:hypothetical protein